MPGGLSTGSSSFSTGFDGGLGESGFGSRGLSQSFSTPEHGSTVTYYTTGGANQGSFSSSNMDLATLLGMNQNGFGMRNVYGQSNNDGVVRTITSYRTMSNPMGNGYGKAFRGGDSGRGYNGRDESDLDDYESSMGGRGNSIGGGQDYGRGNGDSYDENEQPSEFRRSSGSRRGGNSNGFGFGHSSGAFDGLL